MTTRNLERTEGSELAFIHVFRNVSDDSIVNFGLKNSGASKITREKSLPKRGGPSMLGNHCGFHRVFAALQAAFAGASESPTLARGDAVKNHKQFES